MKAIIKHILVIAVLLSGAVYFALQSMHSYTRHDETIQVPDLRSYSISEVEDTLTLLNLQYVILDTAAYNPSYPKSSVTAHDPLPGVSVKKDRKIYLTLNPPEATMVTVPYLKDQHLRRAISFIESSGLVLGRFIYKDDLARDVVIGMKYEKNWLKSGESLPKGAKIDIVLGNGNGQVENAPELTALTLREAVEYIHYGSMNLGRVRYDKTVTDSLSAFVYKQKPAYDDNPVKLGYEIDLWMTADSTKLPDLKSEMRVRRDSLNAIMKKLTERK